MAGAQRFGGATGRPMALECGLAMPTTAAADEPRYAWVVVWAAFASLALIFGVAYSFAAFFESFAAEFAARRADVSMVFGLSGLLYFVLGAGALQVGE